MAAAWPIVLDRLVALLPSLPGWTGVSVYDGPQVGGDAPLQYCTVGFVEGEAFGGAYEQFPDPGRAADREVGTVRSQIVVATGETDLRSVRARAFELVESWRSYLIANRGLGVFPADFVASLAVDVEPAQTAGGSLQALTVTLSYEGVV